MKREKTRNKCAEEIFESEKTYCRQLNIMIQVCFRIFLEFSNNYRKIYEFIQFTIKIINI